jgi:hypothetical protein
LHRRLSILIASIVLSTVITITYISLLSKSQDAYAHSGDVFVSACGTATIDGQVSAFEWISATTLTFQLVPVGAADVFTGTFHMMNGGAYLYFGFTINDNEYVTSAQYLIGGDSIRIDFDNDHSGSLYTIGDNVLFTYAGAPPFADYSIVGVPAPSSAANDLLNGGSKDGQGASQRIANLNHFELRTPLCSGELLDFCLKAGDTVGFRLEYFDGGANGSFEGSHVYPDSGPNAEADLTIGACNIPDWLVFLPLTLND